MFVAASHVMNPAIVKKLPYDTVKDFTPLGLIADIPSALVTHPSLPAKNVKELIALGRAHPGAINFSSGGRGTVGPSVGRAVQRDGESALQLRRLQRLASGVDRRDGGPCAIPVFEHLESAALCGSQEAQYAGANRRDALFQRAAGANHAGSRHAGLRGAQPIQFSRPGRIAAARSSKNSTSRWSLRCAIPQIANF